MKPRKDFAALEENASRHCDADEGQSKDPLGFPKELRKPPMGLGRGGTKPPWIRAAHL